MREKKVIVLDLNGVKYIDELHERIRLTFGFEEWYGANWSAFWDLLSTEVPAEFTDIEITGLTKLPAELTESGEKMIEIIQENKEYREEVHERLPDYECSLDYHIID